MVALLNALLIQGGYAEVEIGLIQTSAQKYAAMDQIMDLKSVMTEI